MRNIVRVGRAGKGQQRYLPTSAAMAEAPDGRVELIQALIPLGLEAVNHLLQQEVTALAGERYRHGDGQAGYARWGQQPGSVYLSDQKIGIQVPRVRDVRAGQEVPLPSSLTPTGAPTWSITPRSSLTWARRAARRLPTAISMATLTWTFATSRYSRTRLAQVASKDFRRGKPNARQAPFPCDASSG